MEWRFPYAQAPLLPDKTKELKHGGYVYAVSPYSLAWNGDNYYLIGFSEKHGSTSCSKNHQPEIQRSVLI